MQKSSGVINVCIFNSTSRTFVYVFERLFLFRYVAKVIYYCDYICVFISNVLAYCVQHNFPTTL